jgi:hypothetical protein
MFTKTCPQPALPAFILVALARILHLIGRCTVQVELEGRTNTKSPLSTFSVADTINVQ